MKCRLIGNVSYKMQGLANSQGQVDESDLSELTRHFLIAIVDAPKYSTLIV